MPSAPVGPGAAIEPPLAGVLLTVSNGLAVSNDHSKLPSLSDTANSLPLAPPASTPPGHAVTAREVFPPGFCRLIQRREPAPPAVREVQRPHAAAGQAVVDRLAARRPAPLD